MQAKQRGYKLVVVSNQAGIARRLMTVAEVNAFNQIMADRLAQAGVLLDAIYFCPHHPDPTKGFPPYVGPCECRKPAPGMLLQAAREHDIDLAKSWMIGDRQSDLQAGWNAGCRSILVKTGYGSEAGSIINEWSKQPDYVAEDLTEALTWILH